MTKKEVIELWFQLVWTEEKEHVIHEMFVPEKDSFGAKGLNKRDGLTPDEFVEFHRYLLKLVKNVEITVDRAVEDGDWIFAECTFRAENRLSGNSEPISMGGCVVLREKDGKLIEGTNYFDFFKLFEELDLLPENTLANCLTGKKIKAYA